MLAEALDKALQHTLYLHKVEALQTAIAQLERNAGDMFTLQSYDVMVDIYQADLREATKKEEDRRKALLALIAAALAARVARDVLILRPGLIMALSAALMWSGMTKYGVTYDLRAIDAERYLTQHGAELVLGINDYTRRRMGALLARSIEEGDSIEAMTSKILASFDEMTYARARKIAVTESNKAWSYAEMQSAEGMESAGFTMVKEWILGPMHPRYDICDHNNEEGAIPLHQLFSSGDMAPPQHPNCGCGLITYPDGGTEQPWGTQVNGQTPFPPVGFDTGDNSHA